MSNNLGRYVKWQDEQGGWHTGREVTCYFGPKDKPVQEHFYEPPYYKTLVRESCNGNLAWVNMDRLQNWQMRSEWEDEVREQVANMSFAVGPRNTWGPGYSNSPSVIEKEYWPKLIEEKDKELNKDKHKIPPSFMSSEEYSEAIKQQAVLGQIERNYTPIRYHDVDKGGSIDEQLESALKGY